MSDNLSNRDIRCYLTNAGRAAELKAMQQNKPITITHMIIDSIVLADAADPKKVSKIASPAHAAFPASVNVKADEGILHVISDIPAEVGGFHINGVAYALADGTIYAYARGMGDFKRKATSGQNDVLRIECEIKTSHADSITHTYDDSQIYVNHFEFNEYKISHENAADPHPQYQQKAHAANESEIDSKASSTLKHINLSMLWRAINNAFSGRRINTTGALKGGKSLSGDVTLSVERATTTRLGVTQLTDDDGVNSDLAASQKLVMRLKVALTNLINTKHTEAKSYTDTKHGEAINHTNVEKGKTIELLKAWVQGLFIKKEDLSHLSKGLFSKLDVTSEFGLSDYGMRNSTYCHMFTEAKAGFYAYKDFSASNLISREQVVITSPTPTREHHATRRDFVLGLDKENVKKDSEENVNLKLVNNSHHAGRSWDRLDETAQYLLTFTPPRNGASGAGNIDIYINNFGAASFSLFAHNALGTTYLTGFCSGGIYSNIRLLGCRDANDVSKFHVYVKLNTGSIGYTPRAVFDLVGDFEFNEPDSLPTITNEWSSDVAKFASIDSSGRVKAQRFEMPSSGLLMGNVNMMGSDVDITRFGDATAQRTVLLKAKDCKIEVNDGGPKRYAIFHENNLPTAEHVGALKSAPSWVPTSSNVVNLGEIENGFVTNYGSQNYWTDKPDWLSYGIVESRLHGGLGYQLVFDSNHPLTMSGKFGYRTHNTQGWGDVIEVYTTQNKPTAEEVGAHDALSMPFSTTDYRCSLTKKPQLIDSKGQPIAKPGSYLVRLYTIGTATRTGATYVVTIDIGSSPRVTLISRLGVGSNHPELITEDGVLKVMTRHERDYTVRVFLQESTEAPNNAFSAEVSYFSPLNKPTKADVDLSLVQNWSATHTYTTGGSYYFSRTGAYNLYTEIKTLLNTKVSRSEASTVSAQTTWTDNHAAAFGNGGDFKVFHSGSHSYMDNYTGNVYMRQRRHGGSMAFQCENTEGVTQNVFAAVGGSNTYFTAYYNNVLKFRTTINGVLVNGRLDADTVYEDGERVYSPNNPPPKTLEPGMVILWSGEEPPDWCYEVRGQQFDKEVNPKLAIAFPSGFLKDVRGDFPRFWDNGRGVDPNRGILTDQGDELRSHTHGYKEAYVRDREDEDTGTGADRIAYRTTQTSATGGGETRPRNVAFMAITPKG